jgi:hypothetical protein
MQNLDVNSNMAHGIRYMHTFFGLGKVFVSRPIPGPLYDTQMTHQGVGALEDGKQGRTYGIYLKENLFH